MLPIEEVAREYLKYCVDFDNPPINTKYVLESMYKMNNEKLWKKEFGAEVFEAEKLEQIW